MTRAQKIAAGITIAGVLLGVMMCLPLITCGSQPRSVSLVFEKYGRSTDGSFKSEDVVFLCFTNSSDKSYLLPMVGGTNTSQRDTPLTFDGSYLCIFVFDNQTNSMTQAMSGPCLVVGPHSSARLRVPLPIKCQNRKVGVFCLQTSMGPGSFWTKGIGWGIFRMLPRFLAVKLIASQPEELWIWCNQELSRPDETQH
jgi:hypothetical protein